MRQLKLVDREPHRSDYRFDIRKLYEQLRECGYNASDEDIESAWLMFSEDNHVNWVAVDGNISRNVPGLMEYFTVIVNESMDVGI